ncbi:MAG: M28 family peptidase [Anaerolineales bacterium]
MPKKTVFTYLILILILFLLVSGYYAIAFQTQTTESITTGTPASLPTETPAPVSFDSARAYADVQTQVDFGPRIPGSEGHAKIEAWMRAELESAGWTVEIQNTSRMGHPIHNIIAKRNDQAPEIILAAHYDTRMIADQDLDPAKQTQPVPGANDGASGVAVLLELARTLPKNTQPVWLVFIDTEDNGRIDGWDWILGSRAFVEEVPVKPRAVVILDMIGDANLNINYEKNSDVALRTEIWNTAAAQGHGDVFIPAEKWSMIDDHTPFLEAGIPAVDLIDFDYPYWHTTQDTPDKVSPQSLYAVGDTLWHWIVQP